MSVIVGAMNLLSIQSHVAYGHVGNAAAVFPLQRMGVEVWPVHTVQFSNHTGYGAWQGQVFDAGLIREVVARHRAARRARRMRRRAVGLYGRGRYRRRHSRRGGDRQARQSGGALLLRPGDRRCRPRHLRARGHSGIHEGQGGAGRRYHHAQPVRAGLSVRPRQHDAGAGARRHRRRARSGAARDPGHLAAHKGDAGGRHRPAGVGQNRLLPPAHAEAAAWR